MTEKSIKDKIAKFGGKDSKTPPKPLKSTPSTSSSPFIPSSIPSRTRTNTVPRSYPQRLDPTIIFSQFQNDLLHINKLIPNISSSHFQILVNIILEALQNQYLSSENHKKLQENPNYLIVFITLYHTLSHFFRLKLENNIFEQFLKDNIKMPNEYISILSNVIKARRDILLISFSHPQAHSFCFPSIDHFQYRVDIIISTTFLQKVFRPSLIFRFSLSSGEIYTFEVSIEMFQQLRFSVALLLKNLQTLNQYSILRL